MGKTLLTRLAAVAAGGTIALAAAAPALAHDEAADGFNAVLHGPHHGALAADKQFDKCGIVAQDAGEEAANLIKDGHDVWVFNIPHGQFDLAASVLVQATFTDLDGATQPVTAPGGGYDSWVGPEANPHLVAVSVPAGWTLADADFQVADPDGTAVRVTHTCASTPGEQPGGGDPGEGEPGDGDEDEGKGGGDNEEQPGGQDEEASLPVTGMQVGGLAVLGAGLLAVGIAMMTVRRRGKIAGLTDEG